MVWYIKNVVVNFTLLKTVFKEHMWIKNMDCIKRKSVSPPLVTKKLRANETELVGSNNASSTDIPIHNSNEVEITNTKSVCPKSSGKGSTVSSQENSDENISDVVNDEGNHNAPNQKGKRKKREPRSVRLKKPGFSEECYSETSYYFENGLRKVYPYYFTFTTFTKGRWVGEKLLDVFTKEFRAHSPEEYERCIKDGTLTVNDEKVDVDYRLKHNDRLSNIIHRHEVPVTSDPIDFVHVDDEILVVNKPASIPVHPCGRYRHNTMVFILGKEYDQKNLLTIHRLDRLTSGILLFGKTPQKASILEQQIRDREVEKEYVCRVEGEFPDGEIICEEPIEIVSYKIGVCRVSTKGKECSTTFKKLGFNGKSSVVCCKPKTGRMHQIRVHLQYLGFPIVNDPLYNHPVFGPEKGKAGNIGKSDEQLIKDLITIHNAENWLGTDIDTDVILFPHSQEDAKSQSNAVEQDVGKEKCDRMDTEEQIPHGNSVENGGTKNEDKVDEDSVDNQCTDSATMPMLNRDKITRDENCYECKVRYRDPKPSDLIMYLHAWKYRGPGWSYQTQLPAWAKSDWTETV